MHLAPGGPIELATSMNAKVDPHARDRLIKLYGLDKPLHIQYINWLSKIARFDFGESLVDSRKVTTKIAERLPITLLINILSLSLIFLIAIPIGISSAVKVNS